MMVLFLATMLVQAACSNMVQRSFVEEPTPTAAQTEVPAVTAESSPVGELPDDRQLVVWLPDFAGYAEEGGAGEVLTSAFRQFEQRHPDVRVDVQVKAASGQADIFSYLGSAQRVAPAILPDLVLMESEELWHLADLGLLPFMERAPMELAPDSYPFAIDSVRYNGEWYGVPYAADLMHLAGFWTQDQIAPSTWDELLASSESYLFAAAGGDAYENGAVLLQYVGAGGQLLENGSTSSEEALQAVFEFLVTGSSSGVIPAGVADLATLEGVWSALVAQGEGSGNISAVRYLASRESIPELGYGQVPTRNGLPTALGSTWSFVVLAESQEQRELAFDLIDTLLDPAVQGAWSQYVHHLPTQRSSLAAWSNPNPYTDFLNRQLEVAVALPNGRAFADFAARLIDAQLGVLRGEITPQEAVEAVRGPG